MNWVHWVIPLIAVAVWILSNLAKQREEPRRTMPRPPPLPVGPPPRENLPARPRPAAAPREKVESLRRRLDEQEAARTPQRPLPIPPLPPAVEKPRPKSRPTPISERPVRAAARQPAPAQTDVPMAIAVPAPPPPEPAPPPAPSIAPRPPTASTARVKQVLDLVRDRQTLAAAFMLKEIFDPPLSRRPRGRRRF